MFCYLETSPRFIFFTVLIRNGPIAQLWLERPPDKREVNGSTPFRPTIADQASSDYKAGAVAQLGERRPCKAEVVGSTPISSTKDILKNDRILKVFFENF